MKEVQDKNTVSVHYTGKFTDGTIFDSSESREPLTFTVGEGNLIPGFEGAVVGMKVDESKTVSIPFNQAYGPSSPDLIMSVPRAQLPAEIMPEVGMELMASGEEGQQQVVVITEVTENEIKVDYNHPLAGRDLVFDIRVVDIK
ncbi:MAG: peptidylprolyl isomerase [Bacteroidales bacterium]|nr:peptidylprolyl isomerase [Bacteroidales bacterium]